MFRNGGFGLRPPSASSRPRPDFGSLTPEQAAFYLLHGFVPDTTRGAAEGVDRHADQTSEAGKPFPTIFDSGLPAPKVKSFWDAFRQSDDDLRAKGREFLYKPVMFGSGESLSTEGARIDGGGNYDDRLKSLEPPAVDQPGPGWEGHPLFNGKIKAAVARKAAADPRAAAAKGNWSIIPNYEPDTQKGKVQGSIKDKLGGGEFGNAVGGVVTAAADIATPAFIADDLADLADSFRRKDYLGAAVSAAGIGLSMVPIVGGAFRLVTKAGKTAAVVTKEGKVLQHAGEGAGEAAKGGEPAVLASKGDGGSKGKPSPYDLKIPHDIKVPPRTVEQEYPNGFELLPDGTMKFDIDGMPMVAPPERKIGVRSSTETNADLAVSEYQPFTKDRTGQEATEWVFAYADTAGGYTRKPHEEVGKILIRKEENLLEWLKTHAHELGHLIHDQAGKAVPGKWHFRAWETNPVIEKELVDLYDVMRRPDRVQAQELTDSILKGEPRRFDDVHTPYKDWYRYGKSAGDVGYDPATDAKASVGAFYELWGAAGEAYLRNPDLIKAIAPNVARTIRQAWNADPARAKTLHMNSIAAPVVGAGAAGAAAGAPGAETENDYRL